MGTAIVVAILVVICIYGVISYRKPVTVMPAIIPIRLSLVWRV